MPNFGVYLSATGQDGSDFASVEAPQTSERPVLKVTYRPLQ